MALEREVGFGELLRRYRVRAALTQEELAERARLSAHAISQLERGARRAPRRDTVDLLAEALALTGSERATFEATARLRWQADQTMVGAVTVKISSPQRLHLPETIPSPPTA